MLHHHVFLIIIVMVGSLCAFIWNLHPEEQLHETQQERVYRATTFIFH